MSKLVEVKMPPLDGTEFVVVCVHPKSVIWSDVYCVIDNVIHEFCRIEGCFMNYCETYPWENDINARYFVAED